MAVFDNLTETKKTSKEVFSGKMLHVFDDEVTLPNGGAGTREFVRHIGAVAIVPLTDDGKVVMERQFRYPVNEVILEIPAGKLDSKQEDHLEAAKRELLEETGISADDWTELGTFNPAPAYSDEAITIYLAECLHKGKQKLDYDEFLNIEEIPLQQLVDMIFSGDVVDGKTQTALLQVAITKGLFKKK